MNEKTRHPRTPSKPAASRAETGRKALKKTLQLLNTDPNTLFIAADVSAKEWKLAGAGRASMRPTEHAVVAFDIMALEKWIGRVRERHELGEGPVVFCYEAGRDGFSIVRALEQRGVYCLVVDPGSIEKSSRRRVPKTDRLDAKKLLQKLRTYVSHDRGVFAVVHVPSAEVEDQRRLVRERDRLKKERTGHRNRIHSMLALHGVSLTLGRDLVALLDVVRTSTGDPLPGHAKKELLREVERLELVEHQLDEVEGELKAGLEEPKTVADEQGARLNNLVGIGQVTSTVLPYELLWRDLHNRKEVGSAAGLDGTPRATGHTLDQEQGISKVGHKRIRTLMVDLAWLWVRKQPDSPITHWYYARIDGQKRSKRKAIVAVARRLLIALWRYAVHGVVPEGAHFKTA